MTGLEGCCQARGGKYLQIRLVLGEKRSLCSHKLPLRDWLAVKASKDISASSKSILDLGWGRCDSHNIPADPKAVKQCQLKGDVIGQAQCVTHLQPHSA